MDRYVVIIQPVYCGMKHNQYGLAVDVYGKEARVLEIHSDVRDAVRKLSREKAAELLKKIYDFWDAMDAHARMCSAIDCALYRRTRTFDFAIHLAGVLGLRYDVVYARCDEYSEEYEKLPPVDEFIDVVYNELCDATGLCSEDFI